MIRRSEQGQVFASQPQANFKKRSRKRTERHSVLRPVVGQPSLAHYSERTGLGYERVNGISGK